MITSMYVPAPCIAFPFEFRAGSLALPACASSFASLLSIVRSSLVVFDPFQRNPTPAPYDKWVASIFCADCQGKATRPLHFDLIQVRTCLEITLCCVRRTFS